MSSRARQPLSRANVTELLRRFQAGENGKYLSLQKNNKNVQTSLKTGFAQIFSCRPKNLSCPKFGRAPAPLARPARTPMFLSLNGKTSRHPTPPPPATSPQKRKHGHRHYLQFIPQYILKQKSERLQFKNNTRIFSA